MLTGIPGSANPEALARAMAAMPAVSPAGDIAVLLDQAPPAGTGEGEGRPAVPPK
jgi:hypothetical protein